MFGPGLRTLAWQFAVQPDWATCPWIGLLSQMLPTLLSPMFTSMLMDTEIKKRK